MPLPDPFGARASLGQGLPDYYRLSVLGDRIDLARAPVTLKILLENALRNAGRGIVRSEEVETLTSWRPAVAAEAEVPFMPARVLLQDFTGVPAVVDLAVMRDAMADLGGDPAKVNPLVPADLVIDHSVQVDRFGTAGSFAFNVEREYERNGERYQLLRWAQTAFRDLRVVPPGTGIVHQVNLEFLATVVTDVEASDGSGRIAYPDTLVGTDSHTTMINALGVLGYGVGGIEAEAVLLGQPLYQPMPRIVGVRLHGTLPRGSTATDLVLVVTEMLRAYGVVGAFVEFAGDGLAGLSLADRATISNMSPEFGATSTIFPIDDETIAYLRLTGRSEERIALVETYAHAQGLWREPGRGPDFDAELELDLATVDPSVAGPRRPQDRVPLTVLRENFRTNFPNGLQALDDAGVEGRRRRVAPSRSRQLSRSPRATRRRSPSPRRPRRPDRCRRGGGRPVRGAGAAYRWAQLPAHRGDGRRRASDDPHRLRGDRRHHLVHQHLEPDSHGRRRAARPERRRPRTDRVVRPSRPRSPRARRPSPATSRRPVCMEPLEALGFALAGYGCTTCIGNSGPLDEPSRRRSRRTTSSSRLSCRATATSRAGSIRSRGRATSPRRRSSSPSRWPAGSTSTCSTEPLGTGSDGRAVYPRRHLADARRDPPGHRRLDRPGAVPADLRGRLRGRRSLAGPADPVRRPLRLGPAARRTSPSRRSSRA